MIIKWLKKIRYKLGINSKEDDDSKIYITLKNFVNYSGFNLIDPVMYRWLTSDGKAISGSKVFVSIVKDENDNYGIWDYTNNCWQLKVN